MQIERVSSLIKDSETERNKAHVAREPMRNAIDSVTASAWPCQRR